MNFIKCTVVKKYFDPFEQRRKYPGEIVEIPDDYLPSYKAYVSDTNAKTVEPQKVVEEIIDPKDYKSLEFIERPRKKKKSGDG